MTLIEMVREARKRNHNYIAVDYDRAIHSFKTKPHTDNYYYYWNSEKFKYLCEYKKMPFKWKESLIDVNEIKVV